MIFNSHVQRALDEMTSLVGAPHISWPVVKRRARMLALQDDEREILDLLAGNAQQIQERRWHARLEEIRKEIEELCP